MKYISKINENKLVSGITVSKDTYIAQKQYYDDERESAILSLVLMLFGAYGFVGALLTDMGIHNHNIIIYIFVLILCLIFSVVFYFQEYIKYTMPAALVVFVLFVAIFYRMINIGYHKSFATIVDYLNNQYGKNFTAPVDMAGQTYTAEVTLFLLTITFLICWVLSVWIIYRPRASFLFLLLAPVLFLEAATGITPNPLCLGMILISILGTIIGGHIGAAFQKPSALHSLFRRTQHNYMKMNEDYYRGIQFRAICYQGGLFLAAVIVVGAISFFPANALFDANQSNLQGTAESSFIVNAVKEWAASENNPLSFLFASKGIGGIGDGRLGNVGSVEYSGQDDLIVTTSVAPENTIYIKAFTGDFYGNNRWTTSFEETYYEVFTNRYYQIINEYTNSSEAVTSEINIDNLGANTAYSYVPYFSEVQSLKGKFIATSFMDIQGAEDNFRTVNASILERCKSAQDSQYIEYALPGYLQLPDSGLERLEKQCSETGYYGMEDIAEIDQYIIETLYNTTQYSLSPGMLPRGEEFTEYFLYEQKEGYCAHYATAATLMYRMFGIPARFVMGYSVVPSLFTDENSDDEYEAVVKAERAHAWTEVYLEGMGWVPVEVTPGDIESAMEAEGIDVFDDFEQSTVDQQSADKKGFNNSLLKALTYLLPTIIICILLLIMCRNLRVYRKRFGKPDMANPNEGIKQVYINLYQIFIFAGLSKTDYLSDAALSEFVQLKFSVIDQQQFGHFMDLVLQANYSNHAMTTNDIKEAAATYDCCRSYFVKQLSWVQRVRFKVLCPLP